MVACSAMLVSCSATADSTPDAAPPAEGDEERNLASRIQAARSELEKIEKDIWEKREEARFLSCKADVEGFNADIALARAQCQLEAASQARCAAEVERKMGDSSLLGCVFGLAVAAYTGGSAAPWALGGCAAGRAAGEMTAAPCPMPECLEQAESDYKEALSRRGWTGLPQCGGVLGVTADTPLIVLVGVVSVESPGVLARGGMQEGDKLAYIGEERFKDTISFDERIRPLLGQQVTIKFARNEALLVGQLTLPKSREHLRYRLTDEPYVAHRWGARVSGLHTNSASGSTQLLEQDIIEVDGKEVPSVEGLRDLLRYKRAGEEVELVIRTPKTTDTRNVRVTLRERDERWTL